MSQTKAQLLGPVLGDVNYDSGTLFVDSVNNKVGIGTSGLINSGRLTVYNNILSGSTDYNGQNFAIVVQSDGGDSANSEGNGIVFTQQYAADNVDPGPVRTGAIVGWKNQSSGSFGGGLKLKVQPTGANPLIDAICINQSANIGIGTTNPIAKLHVIGNQFLEGGNYFTANTSGYFFAGSGSFTGGIFASNSGNVVTIRSPQTTVFENNLQERFRIDSSGNIGIGTTTVLATYKLEIDNGTATNFVTFTTRNSSSQLKRLYIQSSNLDTTPVYTFSTGAAGTDAELAFAPAGSEALRITNGRNVGIGITNPSSRLQVNGGTTQAASFSITGNTNASGTGLVASFAAGGVGDPATTKGGYIEVGASSSGNVLLGIEDSYPGIIKLKTTFPTERTLLTLNPTGDIIFLPLGSEQFRITSGGNIGIGTTNPTKKVQVDFVSNSNFSSSDAPNSILIWNKSNYLTYPTQSAGIHLRGGDSNAGGGVISGVRRGPSNHGDLVFSTSDAAGANVEKVRITSAGNVGIGSTDPQYELDIRDSGSSTNAGNIAIRLFYRSTGTPAIGLGSLISVHGANSSDASVPQSRIEFGGIAESVTAGSERTAFVVNTASAAGSGTTVERLRVSGSGNLLLTNDTSRFVGQYEGGTVNPATANYFAGMECRLGADRNLILVSKTGDSGGNIIFQSGFTTTGTVPERLRVTSTGNVGIGITNPSYKLDVNGSIRAYSSTVGSRPYLYLTYDVTPVDGAAHGRITVFKSSQNSYSGKIHLQPQYYTGSTYDYLPDALVVDATGHIGIGTAGPSERLHVVTSGITASAPSLGWPVYNAETDTNARRILFETAGNGSVSTTGQGATLALVLGNYWDSRVVITPYGAGGASPSDQGTSRGKDMLIKAGTSDNNNVLGGRLFLSGGSGWNGGYNTNYGVVSIQPFGGNVGIGTTTATFGKLEVRGGSVACYGAGFNSWSTDFSTYVVDYAKGGYSVWPGLESGRWMTHYGAFVTAGNAGARIYSYQNGSINATICDLHPSGSTIYGNTTIQGSLSKTSGSFKIDHPLPEKTETHYLVHSFVESPQANNIYRGKVTLVNGEAKVNLDKISGMTEGTFVLLNRDIHCFTSNESNWDNVKGNVEGNILNIICQNAESTATISWLVIGERHDKHMYDTEWTDDDGRVIVEPLKSQ